MVERNEEICRTCLGGNKNMFDLFTSGSASDINLADMLMSFVSMKIDSGENLPHLMCSECIKALTISYNFKKQCERSDVLLRSNRDAKPEENTIEVIKTDEFVSEHGHTDDENLKIENVDIFEEYEVSGVGKKYKCNLCNRSFTKPGNLNLHMKTHTENNKCSHCNINFSTHEELLLHNKKNHKFFNCSVCDKSFATGNALNAHMRSHKMITEKTDEKAEYICVVGVDDDDIPTSPTKVQKFEGEVEMSEINATVNCGQCSLPCMNDETLQWHEKIHEESHECIKCQLIFVAYTDLIEHNKTIHNIHNCSKCIKSFPTVYGLSGHSSTHVLAEGNPCIMYKCTVPDCDKKYRTLDYLKQHILAHTKKNRVYLCKICGKVYNSSNSFYYHKKIHMDNRPYVCTYCGNAYKIHSHLKTHMWRHSSVLPYHCDKCGKGFTRGRILRKHMETNCGSKKRRKQLVVSDTRIEVEEEEEEID